jgi:hypothetical protein
MARYLPVVDEFPLEEELKEFKDEELLDFWEETQFLEKMHEEEPSSSPEYYLEYERLILQELQLRSCRKTLRSK